MHSDLVIVTPKGNPAADSRRVAEVFEKRHGNVLAAIRNLNCTPEFRRLNFQSFKINDLTGDAVSHVLMTPSLW